MARYLLDTNHLSAAIRPGSVIRERLREQRARGARVRICIPALCELEVGASQVKDPAAYREILKRFMVQIPLWPLESTTARIYADIYHDLRSKGRILSQVDMMLAALARQMRMVVLTTDRDFEALSWLRTEDWTQPAR